MEITGYVWHEAGPTDAWYTWYSRSARHPALSDTTATCTEGTDPLRCQGHAYKGSIQVAGRARWQKELWHAGGYTNSWDNHVPDGARSLEGRWTGWKVVIWNITDAAGDVVAVGLRSFVDWDADGTGWDMVSDQRDEPGSQVARTTDTVFACPGCERHDPRNDALTGVPLERGDIIAWGGPQTVWRSDGTTFRFKWLSVREIVPPP